MTSAQAKKADPAGPASTTPAVKLPVRAGKQNQVIKEIKDRASAVGDLAESFSGTGTDLAYMVFLVYC